MTPPHSGQMQFTMADLTLAIDRIVVSIYSSFNEEKYPVLEKVSQRNTYAVVDLCGLLLATVSGSDRAFPELFLITSLSLTRALASRALTVPVGTPSRSAVSRMLKPSMLRKWKVVRKVGERREVV